MELIVRSNQPVLSLFPGEKMGGLTLAITKAVDKSFEEFPVQNRTRDEIRRRFDICVKWAKVLRGDLKWTYSRVFDHMYPPLKAELSGSLWTPPRRSSWMPDAA